MTFNMGSAEPKFITGKPAPAMSRLGPRSTMRPRITDDASAASDQPAVYSKHDDNSKQAAAAGAAATGMGLGISRDQQEVESGAEDVLNQDYHTIASFRAGHTGSATEHDEEQAAGELLSGSGYAAARIPPVTPAPTPDIADSGALHAHVAESQHHTSIEEGGFMGSLFGWMRSLGTAGLTNKELHHHDHDDVADNNNQSQVVRDLVASMVQRVTQHADKDEGVTHAEAPTSTASIQAVVSELLPSSPKVATAATSAAAGADDMQQLPVIAEHSEAVPDTGDMSSERSSMETRGSRSVPPTPPTTPLCLSRGSSLKDALPEDVVISNHHGPQNLSSESSEDVALTPDAQPDLRTAALGRRGRRRALGGSPLVHASSSSSTGSSTFLPKPVTPANTPAAATPGSMTPQTTSGSRPPALNSDELRSMMHGLVEQEGEGEQVEDHEDQREAVGEGTTAPTGTAATAAAGHEEDHSSSPTAPVTPVSAAAAGVAAAAAAVAGTAAGTVAGAVAAAPAVGGSLPPTIASGAGVESSSLATSESTGGHDDATTAVSDVINGATASSLKPPIAAERSLNRMSTSSRRTLQEIPEDAPVDDSLLVIKDDSDADAADMDDLQLRLSTGTGSFDADSASFSSDRSADWAEGLRHGSGSSLSNGGCHVDTVPLDELALRAAGRSPRAGSPHRHGLHPFAMSSSSRTSSSGAWSPTLVSNCESTAACLQCTLHT